MQKHEIRFELSRFIIVLIVVMITIVAAYMFGYYFGQETGYGNAMNENLAGTPKYPIVGNIYNKELDPQKVTEAYAKLAAKEEISEEFVDAEKDSPELTNIKEVEEEEMIGESSLEALGTALMEDSNGNPGVKREILGQNEVEQLEHTLAKDVKKNSDTTLGSLLPTPTVTTIEKVTSTPQNTPTPTKSATPTPTKSATPQPTQQVQPARLLNGYYVQVGSHKDLRSAQAAANRLRMAGFPAGIEVGVVNKETWYRVLAGPERTNVMAERLRAQLIREKAVAGGAFIRAVK